MNLNVHIAKSGLCSRRKADNLIKEGSVTVNGVVVREPWRPVAAGDAVAVKGRALVTEKHVYIIFNKPYGVTSTVEDRHAEKKIVDLVPKSMGRVYPVGRLDKMSRGLIILTNDGELCNRLTHPRYEIEKEYYVTIAGRADEGLLSKLRKGVEDAGELLAVKFASIHSADEKRSCVNVVVCEGKKRHIRRLFLALGFRVLDLRRVRIGSLQLGSLKEGEYQVLTRDVIYKKTLGGRRR